MSKYVIAHGHDEFKLYLADFFINPLDSGTILTCDIDILKAKIYNSYRIDKSDLDFIGDPSLKVLPICPICDKVYETHPTIYRKNNKTKICTSCGTREALEIFQTKRVD
ncbi:MAG: hypothetical protein MR411_01905 [Tenericutes bacterium]|nr:hypothetical protein [Mycoplasmatota bacterium]